MSTENHYTWLADHNIRGKLVDHFNMIKYNNFYLIKFYPKETAITRLILNLFTHETELIKLCKSEKFVSLGHGY